MRLRTAVVLLLVFAGAFMLLEHFHDNGSMTLTQLTAGKNPSTLSRRLDDLAQVVREREAALLNLKAESFFFAVLGICGVLLALRAGMSALQMIREGPSTKALKPVEQQVKRNKTKAPLRVVWSMPQKSWMPYAHTLTGRMMLSFTCIVGAFGLLTIVLVYFTAGASLRRHAIQRARITAINISDAAPGYLLKKNAQGLSDLLRKQASRPQIAYVLVQNKADKIFADSFTVLPKEIQNTLLASRVQGDRSLRIDDAPVIEMSVPISNGLGAVRLGLWRDEVEAEVRHALRPLLFLLFLVAVAGIVMAVYLASRINRPITRLVNVAKKISGGDLEAPSFGTSDRSEFGELAQALERMRSSIKAALVRLEK